MSVFSNGLYKALSACLNGVGRANELEDKLATLSEANAFAAAQTIQLGSAADPGALLLGGGDGTDPNTTATANKNFIEFRCETTATTAGSDTRLAYLRTYFAGATTGGGETLRVFSTVEAACGTVRGAHISLNWGASGSVSGLGTALTATLHVPNTGTLTGTLAAIEAQVSIDSGGDDDAVIPASHGLIRASLSGDTTNDGFTNFLDLSLPANQVVAASTDVTHMVTTGTSDTTPSVGIKCRINGTTYYLLAAASISS